MIKEKLIEELQKLPDGIEVCLFDWKKNLHFTDSDPTGEGIYPEFEVELLGEDSVEVYKPPFAVLSFLNDDYDENGYKIID